MTPRGTGTSSWICSFCGGNEKIIAMESRGDEGLVEERERDGEQIREERETNVFNLKVGGKKRAL